MKVIMFAVLQWELSVGIQYFASANFLVNILVKALGVVIVLPDMAVFSSVALKSRAIKELSIYIVFDSLEQPIFWKF